MADRGFNDFEGRFQDLKARFESARSRPLGSAAGEFAEGQEQASADLDSFWQEAQASFAQAGAAAASRLQQFRSEMEGRRLDQVRNTDELQRQFREAEDLDRRFPRRQLNEGTDIKPQGGGGRG